MRFPESPIEAAEELIRRSWALASQGKVAEALRAVDRIAQNELPASLLSNLGSLFSLCQRQHKALECFRRATERDAGNHTYFYNLATAQRAVGDLRGAEASCNLAIRLNGRDYQALYLRSDLSSQTLQSNHVSELECLLAAGIESRIGKTLVCFALAKELDDIGQFDRAFDCLSVGAATYRRGLRYNVIEDVIAIDTIIATHNVDALGSVRTGCYESEPIFVIGMPRSGTTLVERLIQGHTDVISVGERNDFAMEIVRLTDRVANRDKPDRGQRIRESLALDMAELGHCYLKRVAPEQADPRRTLDKMPINYLYSGLIHAALPRAKIVSVRRNPIDTCYAAFKTFLAGPYAFTYDLEELGTYYLAYRRLMHHWRVTLPTHVYLEVHYEAIVKNCESEARRILEFLGLPWQEGVMDFFRSDVPSSTASAVQVRQPVYSTSVGKWHRYRAQLAPLARRLEEEIPDLYAQG